MPKNSRNNPRAKNPRRSRAVRLARLALWAAGAALLLAILLTAGASYALHRILATGAIKRWVSGNPEELRLEYASASGWFPWDVRVRALEMRMRDPTVEYYFRIDDARLSFSPLALLAREIHFTRVRGNGLTFLLRLRTEPPEPPPAHFAALPPIPGFPDRPKPEGDAPEQASKDGLFRVHVDDLRITPVHEVWIDLYRYRGGGALDGSFDLTPHRHAEVGPARLTLSGGDLTLGTHALAHRAAFEVRARIRQFDPRLVRGDAVWPFISGRARLEGALAGLGFINYFLDGGEPRLSGGAGSARLALDVDKGLGTGTLALTSRDVTARYRKADLRGNAAIRVRFAPWDFEKNRFNLSGTRVELTNVSSGGPGPDSRNWWGRFELPAADLRAGKAGAFVTKVSLHCRDARPLFTLFDTNLPGWARDVLKLEGLEAAARVRIGKSLLDIEGLEAAGGSFTIRGRYRSARQERQGAFLVETGALAVGLEIEGKSSKLKLLGARSWYEGEAAQKTPPSGGKAGAGKPAAAAR